MKTDNRQKKSTIKWRGFLFPWKPWHKHSRWTRFDIKISSRQFHADKNIIKFCSFFWQSWKMGSTKLMLLEGFRKEGVLRGKGKLLCSLSENSFFSNWLSLFALIKKSEFQKRQSPTGPHPIELTTKSSKDNKIQFIRHRKDECLVQLNYLLRNIIKYHSRGWDMNELFPQNQEKQLHTPNVIFMLKNNFPPIISNFSFFLLNNMKNILQ